MTQTFPLETLEAAIPPIFDQAQLSTANHRKNYTALHKLSLQAASVRQSSSDGRTLKLVGEKQFCAIFIDMTARVLSASKGCTAADRVIKFIGAYIQFALKKGVFPRVVDRRLCNLVFVAAHLTADDEDADNVPAVRFTSRLLKWLLQGINAKEKIVRLRVVSLVTDIIGHLNEMECVHPAWTHIMSLTRVRVARICTLHFARTIRSALLTRKPPSGAMRSLACPSSLRETS